MRYFSIAFVLALLLVSASSIRVRDVMRRGGAATMGGAAAGGGSDLAKSAEDDGGVGGQEPASDGGASDKSDDQGNGSGGAFDKAVDTLGLNADEVTQGVKKNIAAQIGEADTKNKANMMVKMAKENSKKLITSTMEGLLKTPPKYNHQGKWILPPETPINELTVVPQMISRGTSYGRAQQKKFDDIVTGKDKSGEGKGLVFDNHMSTSNAVLFLAKIQDQRADEAHLQAEALLANNCGDPLVAPGDCNKVEVDVPYTEADRGVEDVMQDPKYSNDRIETMMKMYNLHESSGPPVLRKSFTNIRDLTSELHMNIDKIGVDIRRELQHAKKIKQREAGLKKQENKQRLINQAKEESTKVLNDEEVSALKSMKKPE